MKRVFVVHGWDGTPTSDWIGWTVEELRKKGYDAIAPEMPNTEHPIVGEWLEHLRSVVGTPDEQTYFIGHSVAALAIMHYLQTIDRKVGGAIFVAPWFDLDMWFESQNHSDPEEEAIAKPWIETPIDFAKVRENLDKSVAVFGEDDPVVEYKKTAELFKERLGSEVVGISNGGHMDIEDGFATFPQLIEIFESRFGSIK